MAFNTKGYRQAALAAGIPTSVIEETIASRTGVGGWLTNGKAGIGAVGAAAGNILNLPSYAIGGLLNRGQRFFGSKYGRGQGTGLGVAEGIKNKRAVMSELPETLGVDPTSKGGMAIGLVGELLTPDLIGIAGDIGRASGLMGKAGDAGLFARVGDDAGAKLAGMSDAGLFARVGNDAGTKLADLSDDVITKGLGQPQALKKIEKITKEKPGAFIKRLGLESRDAQEAMTLKSQLIKQFNEIGLNSKTKSAVAPTIKAFDDEIVKQVSLAKMGSETAAKTAEELAKRKAMFLSQVKNADELGVDVFTQLKRAAASDVPETKIGLGMSGSAKADAAEFARKQFQQGAIRGDKRLAQIGTDIRALGGSPGSRGLIDVFEGAQARNIARSPLNFGKLVSGGIGGTVAGLPGAIGGAVVETVARSPKFAKASSDVLEAGSKIAPRVGRITQKAAPYIGRAARTGFRVSNQSNPSTSGIGLTTQNAQYPKPQSPQQQLKKVPYNQTLPPTIQKNNIPTAEQFYAELRKRRGY
jgi:hypothetical protein